MPGILGTLRSRSEDTIMWVRRPAGRSIPTFKHHDLDAFGRRLSLRQTISASQLQHVFAPTLQGFPDPEVKLCYAGDASLRGVLDLARRGPLMIAVVKLHLGF